jgi:uncharacterized protein Veg
MAAKNALIQIRRDVESSIGKRVKLKANRGRRKTFEKEGIIEKTYPNIFVIKLDDKTCDSRRVTYSYSDILTETVEITVYNTEGHKKIQCVG